MLNVQHIIRSVYMLVYSRTKVKTGIRFFKEIGKEQLIKHCGMMV